jgi:Concanavalin A-like lectin/glucanases superfamily
VGGAFPDQATIVGWFNMTTLPSLDGHTFYIAGESIGGDDLDLQIDTDNTLRFYTDSGGSTANSRAFTTADTNVWHFVAASFSSSFSRNIYLDGALVGSSTPGSHDATHGGQFTMGESPVWTGRFFHGALDEIAFFNRQLSDREINNLYIAAGFTPVSMQIHQLGKFVVLTWTVPSATAPNPHAAVAGPVAGTNYVLETATSLRPGTVWQPFNAKPVITGNTFQLTFPVTNSVQFFRLRAK